MVSGNEIFEEVRKFIVEALKLWLQALSLHYQKYTFVGSDELKFSFGWNVGSSNEVDVKVIPDH